MFTAACYGMWVILWKRGPRYKQQMLWLLFAAVLSSGLAAIQVLPSIEWIGQIDRTLNDSWPPMPLSRALSFFSRDLSANPNSAGIGIPGETAYVGALCLIAAILAAFHRNKRDFIFFSAVIIFSLWSVYGIRPMEALYNRVPIFKGLKKEEALVLVNLALAVLAGLGVSLLEEWSEWAVRKRVWLVGTVILATAGFHSGTAMLSKMTKPGVDWWRSPRSFRVLLVLSAILVLLRIFQVLSRRQWAVLATVVIALDVVSFSHAYFPFNSPSMIFPRAAMFDFLSGQPQPFRVVTLDSANLGNIEPIYGLSAVGGYDFMLKRLVPLTAGLGPYRRDSIVFTAGGILASNNRILDLLNGKYIVATRFNESLVRMRSQQQRFREIWSDGNVTIFENLHVLPRAFLVPQTGVEIVRGEAEQLSRLQDPAFDPARAVILSAGSQNAATVASIPKSESAGIGVTGYEEQVNSVRIEANAPSPSVLVLNQMYYPGWIVRIDGKEAPVLRANYAFAGTFVDTGIHRIEFRFLPRSFVIGTILSIVSILLATLVCFGQRLFPGRGDWYRRMNQNGIRMGVTTDRP
jgi:hypothetical protein